MLKFQNKSKHLIGDPRHLSEKQMEYAATDVLYLHRLKAVLQELLKREGRESIAKACFEFIPARCELDIQGWNEVDIFQH